MSTKTIHRPLPEVTEDTAPFWEATRERTMKLQRCDRCGRFWYYPGPVCPFCGSIEFTWTPVSGEGTIYSFSLLERAKGNPFEGDVPIAIILVRLAEGPVMMSNLIDYAPEDLAIDRAVVVDYEVVNDSITLPVFRPRA
jgi:uncharacterized OB-fold protein